MSDLTVNASVNSYAPTSAVNTAETKAGESNATKAAETKTDDKDKGVVFEKSVDKKKDSANQIYNRDAVVAKLKADQDARIASMQSLVEKLLGKQVANVFGSRQADMFDLSDLSDDEIGSLHLADTFRQAAANASPEEIAKAQESISEDGYWGVNQTSDRLVSMAIALSGGDTSKADEMMEAIQKGYKKATAAWGEELPQISQDTLKATMDKMNDWKNGVTTAENYNKYLS